MTCCSSNKIQAWRVCKSYFLKHIQIIIQLKSVLENPRGNTKRNVVSPSFKGLKIAYR